MASLVPFTKRFESSENLVDLLESRGLQICDRNKAIQYLDNIGYYRLSAYMYPLLKMPKTAHLYKEGSTFKKVMMLYRFDKKLRLLMFNEIEKIEIAIRRAVMQITADMTGNPFWLTNSSYFLDSSKFNETMRAISKEYLNSAVFFLVRKFYMLRCLFGTLYVDMRCFGVSCFFSKHKIPHPNQWGILKPQRNTVYSRKTSE